MHAGPTWHRGASHHYGLLLTAAFCRLFPNNALAAERLNTFTNAWTKGVDGVEYTPKGLAYSGVFLKATQKDCVCEGLC